MYVIQLDIHPQKAEAYAEHVRQEIPRMLAADMAAWAAWDSSEDMQESLSQLRILTLN